MMRRRLFAVTSCSSRGRSMTSLMRSSLGGLCGEAQPRKGFKRIVGTHARYDTGRQMRRYRVVTVELPVLVIGGKQDHLVAVAQVDIDRTALGIWHALERMLCQS